MACVTNRRDRWVLDFYDQDGMRRCRTTAMVALHSCLLSFAGAVTYCFYLVGGRGFEPRTSTV